MTEQGQKQEEEDLLKLILDSDASSDSDFDEYGDENYYEESELENEIDVTPKENEAQSSQQDSTSRSASKAAGRKFFPSMESQRDLVEKGSQVLKQKTIVKKRLSRKLSKQLSDKKKVQGFLVSGRCRCPISTLNQIFENLVMVLIVLSSLVLILDNPLNDPNATTSLIIKLVDSIFTFLFLSEAIIKILAFGLFSSSLNNQKPYLQVGWNLLDLFVVTASLIDFCYSPTINFFSTSTTEASQKSSLKSLKALRALRALRPLRMISRNEGLKLVVNALFSSLPSLFNVMIINVLFILIFAIIGINFFKGTFYTCDLNFISSTLSVNDLLSSIDTKFDCLNSGGNWINGEANFDNIINAAITLFQLMTTEGWLSISYQGVDARAIDLQPKLNYKQFWIFYFIFFIIIGNMFILNLFVGVVIVNFNRMKDKLCGYVNMSEDQRKWVEMQRFMIHQKLILKRENPTSAIQRVMTFVVNHKAFEIIIMIVIIINTIVMSMRYFNMPSQYSNALEIANYAFAIVFNLECFMKITALHKLYFYNYWNIFDFIVVIGTNLGILFKLINTEKNIATAATIVRSFRIIRIFRLIKSSQNMKVLIDTLVHILPSLANVGSLIFLMLYIFAALGMNLFATVMYQDAINQEANFRSFGIAILTLFRGATGENWNSLMYELANTNGYNGIECIQDQSYESMQTDGIRGCGTAFSYFFYVVFIITVQMIVMNLFVAVVIEGFSSSTSENTGPVTSENYNQLVEKWADYDRHASGWINLNDLAFLIYELDYPLGRKNEYEESLKEKVEQRTNSNRFNQFDYRSKYICNEDKNMILPQNAALKLMIDLDIPVYSNNKVHFKDVCLKLTKDAIERQQKETVDFEGINDIQKQRLDRDWSKTHNGLRKFHKVQILNKYTLNTSMHWAGSFIFKTLRIMRDNNRARRQNQYLSYAIKKRKYEIKKQQEQEQRELDQQQENMLEDNTIYEEEKVTDRRTPNSPKKRNSRKSMRIVDVAKKMKDTERSTWWEKKSTRMEKWLVNQERRQVKKNRQSKANMIKPSQITFYPQENHDQVEDIEAQVPTGQFGMQASPQNVGSHKKRNIFSSKRDASSSSSSESGEVENIE